MVSQSLDQMNFFSEKHLGIKFSDRISSFSRVLDFEVPEENTKKSNYKCVEKYRLCYHFLAFNLYLQNLKQKKENITKSFVSKFNKFSVPICYHYISFKQDEYNKIKQENITKSFVSKFNKLSIPICYHFLAWVNHFESSIGTVVNKFICPKITSLWMVYMISKIRKIKLNKKIDKRFSIPLITDKKPFLIDHPDKITDNYITIEFHYE